MMVARNNKRTMPKNLFILTLSFLRIEGSVLLGWGSRFFLDYAFYQYFQDNSISFLRFSPISEEKAFLNEATNFFIQPSPLNRFRFPIKHCFSLLEPDLEYAFYQYLSNISIIFWHFILQWQRLGSHNINL